MTGPPDDATIIRQSLEQPELFALLYERHAPDIHRYAARRIGDAAADDITADTFLEAFRSRGRFDGRRETARPWLYGIAAHRIGKERRVEIRSLRARAQDPPPAEVWTDQVDHRVTAHAALRGALADLSAGDRHVLLLVAWADLSYQDVADALSIPLGTVRSRLNRARKKVRKALGADPTLVLDASETVTAHG